MNAASTLGATMIAGSSKKIKAEEAGHVPGADR